MISDSSISSRTYTQKQYSLLDSIMYVKVQIMVLLIYLVVEFAISYAAFMRMDVRLPAGRPLTFFIMQEPIADRHILLAILLVQEILISDLGR